MNELESRLLAAFQVEQREYLDGIRSLVQKMAQSAILSSGDLEEAFRLAHSLKAAAQVCGFDTIQQIGRRLEAVFAQLGKGTLPSEKGLALISTVIALLTDWSVALARGGSVPEPREPMVLLDTFLEGNSEQKPLARDDCSSAKHKKQGLKPDDELTSRLLAAFEVEHKEHLEAIRVLLGEMEVEGQTTDRVDEAFRRAHTLKGVTRIAELKQAEVLAHQLETLFARLREGTLQVSTDLVRTVHLGLDAIEDWGACLIHHQSPPNSDIVLTTIDQFLAGKAPPPISTQPVTPSRRLSPPGPTPVPAADTVRIRADNLDRLLQSAGQLLTETLQQDLLKQELTNLSRQISEMERAWGLVRGKAGGAFRQVATLPGMASVAPGLTQVESQLHSLSRKARSIRLLQQRSAWSLGLLGRQLRHEVRRARMVSAETILQGLRKLTRDQAREEGKEIDLRITGLDCEADRLVLQALKDPLMHLLSNAVSHGIEPASERRDKGKREMGQISLGMEVMGNRLRIVLEDDGRGVDRRAVTEAAVRKGLLSQAEARAASEQDCARLLFQPGFSTAHGVTDHFGRGMGLSVVQEALTRLQGQVDLQPGVTAGTRFVLSVPLSIATQRLLLVRSQAQTFAVPVHAIVKLLRIKVAEVDAVEGRPMLRNQGQMLPLVRLTDLLKQPSSNAGSDKNHLQVMVLRCARFASGRPEGMQTPNRMVAVIVDELLAENDALIQDLDSPAADVPGLAGGIVLADGSIALALNPAQLLEAYKPTARSPAPTITSSTSPKKIATVLVVDDSLTTRTLEKSLLEAHGYQVRIAMDGVEALQQLRADLPDLVITDVQMPRMDGFQLLDAIKSDTKLRHVPVIVVTSLERREDQERGLALGADAYIVKRKFDHQELLDTIRQIV